jgi:hypothetical protein
VRSPTSIAKSAAAEKVRRGCTETSDQCGSARGACRYYRSETEKALARGDEASLRRALADLVHSLKVFLKRTEPTVFSDTRLLQAELAEIETEA